MCSVRVTASQGHLVAGTPVDLFPVPADGVVFGPHPDGRRFVFVRRLPATFPGDRVDAILNWAATAQSRTH